MSVIHDLAELSLGDFEVWKKDFIKKSNYFVKQMLQTLPDDFKDDWQQHEQELEKMVCQHLNEGINLEH